MSESKEILLALGELNGKMDSVVGSIGRMTDTIDKHDARIGKVETGQSRLMGIGAGAIGLWGLIMGVIK